MDTTTFLNSLSFCVASGRNLTTLGKVNQTKWFLSAIWTRTSDYSYDLISLKLIRNCRGNAYDDFLILFEVKQQPKNEKPLYLYKNLRVFPDPGQAEINILPENFTAAFDNTDKLTGTIVIFDMEKYMSVLNSTEDSIETTEYAETIYSLPQLSDDFETPLKSPNEFSDVTLKCGDSEIPAHKCILSARSPVFAEMFRNQDAQESGSGIIDITDIKVEVLQVMLKYLYTGKIGDLSDELAGDLLFAADKFELKVLKMICVDKLKSSLSMDNVFRVLVLGHLHDDELKDHTKSFISESENRDKFWKLVETEEWKSLRKEHSVLAAGVLRSLAKFLIHSNLHVQPQST